MGLIQCREQISISRMIRSLCILALPLLTFAYPSRLGDPFSPLGPWTNRVILVELSILSFIIVWKSNVFSLFLMKTSTFRDLHAVFRNLLRSFLKRHKTKFKLFGQTTVRAMSAEKSIWKQGVLAVYVNTSANIL